MTYICPRCKLKYSEDDGDLVCPDCLKEQIEENEVLNEQERNYWKDVCGSIK